MEHQFKKMRELNVNDQVEKKGKFNYLSWASAVDTLLQHDPLATWDYRWFTVNNDSQPYCVFPDGTAMVFCTVTAFDKPMTAQLPILDYQNKPKTIFNSMDINTAMQRCLAKAIALHGIGLYIYKGEDLPDVEPEQIDVVPLIEAILAAENMDALKKIYVDSVKKCNGNKDALTQLEKAKDERKKELSK